MPELYGCFEDDEAVYLAMEYIEGVSMARLKPYEGKVVEQELEGYLEALRTLKSSA